MKQYVITKNECLAGRKYKVVFKEKIWVLIDVGEKPISEAGWPPDKEQIKKFNLNPSHYYYWLSSYKFVKHLEEIEI